MKRIVYLFLLFAVVFASCKKDRITDAGATGTPGGTTSGSTAANDDLLKDSVYMYAQEEYLWNDALPAASVFNPRQFTGSTTVAALQAEVDAISQIKINPSTNKPYEYDTQYPGESKYSYIDQGQAATSIGGTGGDFGFYVFYQTSSDLRVRYVIPNSPAATAGLVRGYKITAINGTTNLAYTSSSDPVITFVGNALAGNSITLTLQKPDNSTFTTTINKGTYTINPVMKYTTLTTSSGKKMGYFALKSFTTLSNAQTKIDEAFNSFIANGVTEMVIDLRYNGGGAVETSQYIANYLVPAAKSGTLMYTENFNSKLQNDIYPLLAKKYRIDKGDFSVANNSFNFVKKGSLNLSRVFFIVTGGTASASELLINNLNPVMNVQIIGQTSYGKPVGFFGIPVGSRSEYDLYLAEFESRNSANKADFYQGMVPGGNFAGVVAPDDYTKDFGDPTEGLLSRAVNYVDKGTFAVPTYQTNSINDSQASDRARANSILDQKQHEFKGAVHTRDLKAIH
jgi:carboxyl-terminal processing protease